MVVPGDEQVTNRHKTHSSAFHSDFMNTDKGPDKCQPNTYKTILIVLSTRKYQTENPS